MDKFKPSFRLPGILLIIFVLIIVIKTKAENHLIFAKMPFQEVAGRAEFCTEQYFEVVKNNQNTWNVEKKNSQPELLILEADKDMVVQCISGSRLAQLPAVEKLRCEGIQYATGVIKGKSLSTAIDILERAAQGGDVWARERVAHLKVRHYFLNFKNQEHKYVNNPVDMCSATQDSRLARVISYDYANVGDMNSSERCKQRARFLEDPIVLCGDAKKSYESSGRMSNADNIFKIMSKASNDSAAISNLGLLNEYGIGAPVDILAAKRLYTLAAESGSPAGARNLALLYERGLSVPQDFKKAKELYTQAAKLNDYFSMYKLGLPADYRFPEHDQNSQD